MADRRDRLKGSDGALWGRGTSRRKARDLLLFPGTVRSEREAIVVWTGGSFLACRSPALVSSVTSIASVERVRGLV